MWQSLIHPDVPFVALAIRAVVVYLSVLILLRVSGKRQLAQMGATEFVAILLISNAVQNAMNGGDNSLSGGLWLALILIAMSTLISFLTYKSSAVSAIFEGTPTLLIHNGRVLKKNMRHERLSEGELKSLLRKQGQHDLSTVKTAILESDGTLSITRVTDKGFSYAEDGVGADG